MCRGVSGPDFRNNTVGRDKKKNFQEPTGRAANTRNQARSLGQRDSTGGRAGTRTFSAPAAHNGVYGFGGEKRNRTVNPEGKENKQPETTLRAERNCPGDKSDD